MCQEKIDVDLDVSWVYSRSAVVMHVVDCPRRTPDASASDMNVVVDQILDAAGQGRRAN
jgi:hypothetical protein